MTAPRVCLLTALLSALILAVVGWWDAPAVWRGIAYALIGGSAVPAGAVALLLIADLTGGRWVDAARARLLPLAASLPAFVLLFGIVSLDLPAVYNWTSATEVNHAYLNEPAFIVRGIIVFILWGAMTWRAVNGPGTPLTAGLALLAYGITVTVAAIDWSMSLDPRWSSTTYGMTLAICQIAAALAILLMADDAALDAASRDDLAKLALAAVLGIVYLGFMQLLVIWSGNLPDRVDYYVQRAAMGWTWVEVVALIIGAVVPFWLLLTRAGRRNALAMRIAGVAVLSGLALHFAWQMLTPASFTEVFAGILALLMTAAALITWVWSAPLLPVEVRRHG